MNKNEVDLTCSGKSMFYIASFLFSCISIVTLSAWMIIYTMIICFSKNAKTAVNFFIAIQIRSLLNPGLVEDVSSVGVIKWLCIFCVSMILLLFYSKRTSSEIIRLMILFGGFALFLIVSAFWVSSYPLVACFKVLSYVIPFLAVIVGVSVTPKNQYIHTVNMLLGMVIIGCVLVYSLPVGYLRNGKSFQGFFNHPNVLGVMVAIFVAGYLYEKNNERKNVFSILLLLYCSFLIYSSFSRTGMISFVLILFIGIISLNQSKTNKVLLIVSIVLIIVFILSISETWRNEITNFIFKGGQSINDITYSRKGQIENNLDRFHHSPYLGTGFNVPFDSDIKSYSFSFDLITENGNLLLAILGDMGIIGTAFFILCYYRIAKLGKGNINGYTIFVAPFIVSMGEMSFFSTNNFALIMYLFFAIYVSDDKKTKDVPINNTFYTNDFVE